MSRTLSTDNKGLSRESNPDLGLTIITRFPSSRLCLQTDARIRSFIFAGCRPEASATFREAAASSPYMLADLASHFVATAGCAHLPKKSLFASMQNDSALKKTNRDHIQRPVDEDRIAQGKTAIKDRLLPGRAPPRSCVRAPTPSMPTRVRWRRSRPRGACANRS